MGFLGSVGTDEKCPKCNKAFERISIERGFICREHLTAPKRFWINGWALGIHNKLYSDRLEMSLILTRRRLISGPP